MEIIRWARLLTMAGKGKTRFTPPKDSLEYLNMMREATGLKRQKYDYKRYW